MAVEIQDGDQVKYKAFLAAMPTTGITFSQWCQYGCGAPSLGIGLAQIHHFIWNYTCSGGKQSICFQAKVGQNLLGQSQRWFKLLCLKVHAQMSHHWRHSFHCRLTISLPRREGWIYQMTQYQHVPSPPKQLPEATGFNSCHLEMAAHIFQRIISKT